MENYSDEFIAFHNAYLSFEYDCMLAVGIIESKKRKRKSPHKIYRQRSEEGAMNVLIDRHLLDDDTKFREYFRLTPHLFAEVLGVIQGDLQRVSTSWVPKPISPRDKLCITLRYLATGETFRSLAFQFRVHYSYIGRIVNEVLCSIVSNFLQKAIPTPTKESFERGIIDFYERWNYPNCCGAIDGKHVRIKCPSNAGSAYFNYKDFHSIVLLAIVDANYKFVSIDVGSYGREGDAGIYLKSIMGRLINAGQFNIPPPAALPSTDIVLPNVILGDEAFALGTNMMKPYPRNQSLHDVTKAIYNYRHSRGRRQTENVFGIMSSYFRIFFTPINTHPEKIDKIVLAACILHNLMRNEKIPSPTEGTFENTDDIATPTENLIPLSNGIIGRPSVDGSLIRDQLRTYFNGTGAVEWQERMVR